MQVVGEWSVGGIVWIVEHVLQKPRLELGHHFGIIDSKVLCGNEGTVLEEGVVAPF